MVFLTMTASIVEGLEKIRDLSRQNDRTTFEPRGEKGGAHNDTNVDLRNQRENINEAEGGEKIQDIPTKTAKNELLDQLDAQDNEPSLENPKSGNPISHGQVIGLSRSLKAHGIRPYNLDVLLRGARVYVPPPAPKPEPTSEYIALMAHLRREEEERSYDRMTNPPPPMESFSQRFPASSAAHAFDSNFYPSAPSDPFAEKEKDEVTYADVDRQMALILNVVISIVACAGAIWIAAKWWSTPTRLALSMSGSLLVGLAEVVVYSGYVRRVADSKGKEKAVKEVKEVMKTWVIDGRGPKGDESFTSIKSQPSSADAARRRKKEHSEFAK